MSNFILDRVNLLKTSFLELTKFKQYLLFFGVSGTVLVGVATALGVKFFNKATPQSEHTTLTKPKEKKIKIESSGARLSQQEVWVDRLERERELLKKRVEELEKLVLPLAHQQLGRASSHLSNIDQTGSSYPYPQGTTSQTLNPDFFGPINETNLALKPSSNYSHYLKTQEKTAHQDQPIEKAKYQRVSFRLDPQFSKKIKRSIDHYVPAGSFVRGVLTSGVVASTSIQASANPQPVHIQLTDLGNLPRGFKSDIQHCFIIGSAYGDLPSERVYMRLEKLSCIERKTQEIIEVTVDGYVAGEDGANGLRGVIVDRSGPAMRNAFIGGFFSGMGEFFGQQKSQMPTSISQSGVAMVNPLNAQHLLQAGVGKGIGNAMEKFSDFYIKRAEQLQPVVEIEPGRSVDVVFKAGFDMNQTVYRQTLMNNRDAERRDLAVHDVAARDDDQHLQTMKGLSS
jgi:conjugal transfer pilus assembly protein TraB